MRFYKSASQDKPQCVENPKGSPDGPAHDSADGSAEEGEEEVSSPGDAIVMPSPLPEKSDDEAGPPAAYQSSSEEDGVSSPEWVGCCQNSAQFGFSA